MQSLGERIRKLRTQRGLSQRQLAGREMTRAFISMLESGRAAPSEQTLGVLASRLRVTAESLAHGRDQDEGWETGTLLLESVRVELARGHADNAARLLRHITVTNGNDGVLADARYLLAEVLFRLGRVDEATTECEAAVESFRTINKHEALPRALLLLGTLAARHSDYARARDAYEEAVMYSGGKKRLLQLHANALMHLGAMMERLGEFEQALGSYQQATDLYANLRTPRERAHSLVRSAVVLLRLGQTEVSRGKVAEAVALCKEAGIPAPALGEYGLGIVMCVCGDEREAIAVCEEVLVSEVGIRQRCRLLLDLAEHWCRQDRLDLAKQRCLEVFAILNVYDDGLLRGLAYRVAGSIAETEQLPDVARGLLRASYDLLRYLRCRRDASDSLKRLEKLRTKAEVAMEPVRSEVITPRSSWINAIFPRPESGKAVPAHSLAQFTQWETSL